MGKKILVSDDGFSELLEGLCGIKAVIPKNSFGNIFTLPSDFKKTRLNEAYYATYPIEKVVGYLKKRYGKTAYVDWLEGENGEEVIEVAMDDSEYNLYNIRNNSKYKKPNNFNLMVEYSKKIKTFL